MLDHAVTVLLINSVDISFLPLKRILLTKRPNTNTTNEKNYKNVGRMVFSCKNLCLYVVFKPTNWSVGHT